MIGLNTLSKEVVRLENEVDKLRGGLEGAASQKEVTALLDKFDKKWSKRIDEIENGIESLGVIDTEETNGFSAKLVELREQLMRIGAMGGQANRDIKVAGVNVLRPFTDINLLAGTNVEITTSPNQTTKYTDITITAASVAAGSLDVTDGNTTVNNVSTIEFVSGATVIDGGGGTAQVSILAGGGSGMSRTSSVITANTTGGSTAGTDYVYICNAGISFTLPDAGGNGNLYTVKNASNSSVLVTAIGGDTMDGSASVLLAVPNDSLDFISDGTNYQIV